MRETTRFFSGDSLRDPLNIRTLAAQSWSIGWPMMVIMLFEFVMSMADVWVAGRIGKEVQAAYGLVLQMYFVAIIVANALTVGSVSVISKLNAAGEDRRCRDAVHTVMLSAAAAGVSFGLAGVVAGPPIVRALAVPAEVKEYAAPLLAVYAAGFIFHYVHFSNQGTLRSSGRVRTALRIQTVVVLVKLPLTYLLAFHTPLGHLGLAVSTVAAISIGTALSSLAIRPLRTGGAYSPAVVREVASVGWPAGLMQLFWQLGFTTLFLVVGSLPENKVETLAAFSNGLRIESAVFLPAFACNMANAVIVGNQLGRGGRTGAFRGGLTTAVLGVAIVGVLTGVVISAAPLIASLLSPDAIVRHETVRYLYVAMIAEPIMAWGVILAGGLNGAGDTRAVMLSVTFAMWVIRLPLAWFLGIRLGLGAAAIYWVMNLSVAIQSALITWRYLGRKWIRAAFPCGS
ncbi:MAG: MATE family efflux transporter [Deltaproteobacteria bacterium]|nr:MATE family efflux transporter [Deltaproteobacteria bacterium]